MRRTPHHQSDIASSQICLDIRKTLVEKHIVPKIRVRKVGDPCKINHQRQTKQVSNLSCKISRMIVDTALCTLHPIDDTSSIWIRRSIAPHGNPSVVGPSKEIL